jgi:hypothetical protein
MGCRYSLGFRLDADDAAAPKDIVISVKRDGVSTRHPAQVQLWTAEETRASRMRAAFADPEQFEHPLVRTFAFPARPAATANAWNTLLGLHAPIPVGAGGRQINVSAEVLRDGAEVGRFTRDVALPAATGSQTQPLSFYGEAVTKPGRYEMRVVLSEPGARAVFGSNVAFEVPELPKDGLILRGPFLARVLDAGLALRADAAEPVLLKQAIGEGRTVEPLTVQEIATTDTLLLYWEACRIGKKPDVSGVRAERRIVTEQGETAHALEPVALELTGDRVQCQTMLERTDRGLLAAGRYEVEIALQRADEDLARERTPLLVD